MIDLVITTGSSDTEYIQESDTNVRLKFGNGTTTTFSVHEIEEEGKLIYGDDFSLYNYRNVYVGAYDNDDKTCCVGGYITSEQRLDLTIPTKQGGDGLTLVTPTPTVSITPTLTNTPSVTPSITKTPFSTPSPTATASITPTTTPTISREYYKEVDQQQ